MKKSRILLILIVIVLLISSAWFYSYYQERKTINEVSSRSLDFVRRWGNFSDEAGSSYLASMEPYLSEDLKNEYQESSSEISAFYKKGYEPNSSKLVTIGLIEAKRINKTEIIVKIKIERSYNDEDSYQATVEIVWGESENQFRVKEISEDKN